MSVLYVIANWSENFENNRTRELKNLAWVPMPNRHDGDGYTELMDHPKAAAHYGAWCAIVQVASKCDPRGTLVRDGQKPHDSRSLSRITRIPEAVFNEAIPRLLEIGWLNAVTSMHDTSYEMSQEGATLGPHPVAVSSHLPALNGMEWNGKKGIEKKGREPAAADAAFDRFWAAFPPGRKSAKAKARAAFAKATKRADPEIIIAAATEYADSPAGRGEFVKGPEPWLNGDCWDDDRAAWNKNQNRTGSGQVERISLPNIGADDDAF